MTTITPSETTTADSLLTLNKRVENAVQKRSSYTEKLLRNFKLRRCIFDHPDKDTDENAFPWMGASDQKVFFIDKEIRTAKALKVNSLFKARMMYEPKGATPTEEAKIVEDFWHWMFHVKMQPRREINLVADKVEEKGLSFVNVLWDFEKSEVQESVAREQWSPEFLQMVQDPNVLEEKLLPEVKMRYPAETDENIIAAIQAVRAKTPMEDIKLKKIIYTKQQPSIVNCTPDEDIIIPEYTGDIQESDFIVRIHRYSKTSLRRDQYRMGYKKAVVDHLIETFFDEHGIAKAAASTTAAKSSASLRSQQDSQFGVTTEDGLVVYDFYEKKYDKEGNCKVTVITYCPQYLDDALRDEFDLNYHHGKYPFVAIENEITDRNLHASRGTPEIFEHIQNELKIQTDSRIDRTTLCTIPPVVHPLGMPPSEMGPGAHVGYIQNRQETGFMEIPKQDPGSLQVSQELRAFASDYKGSIDPGASFNGSLTPRSSEEMSQVGAKGTSLTEYDIENWMNSWQEVVSQCFALCQQFLSDKMWFRAVGDPNAKPIQVSAETIQGEYDIVPVVSMHDLSPARSIEAANQFMTAALNDRTGVLDQQQAYIEWGSRLNMRMAKRIIRSGPVAQQAEIDAEKKALASIFAGMPEQVDPNSNIQIRMQFLSEYMAQPDIQMRMKNDPLFNERLNTRMEQYQFQLQQQANAQTGKFGKVMR